MPTPNARVLVADDEPNLRRVLTAILRRSRCDVVEAIDGQSAINMMDESIDVVVTDLRMPRKNGMEVLAYIAQTYPSVPVIMITAFGSVGHAVKAVKAGAFDYIEKPFEREQIRLIVEKALRQKNANTEIPTIVTTSASDEVGRYGLVGLSSEMEKIYQVIDKVADTPSTVLITGESGTGKELVAKALHEQSTRKDKPFIKINCAAIPKNLMESELFGYEKGAFTGASSSKPGRFELADEGTLFLDEIGEIPVEMQVKLLRAVQESEFERVGGIKTIKVNVRLITATNRDLQEQTRSGEFREDLYYRLNVVPLHVPPLRARESDIPLLTEYIIEKFNVRLDKSVTGVTEAAMKRLRDHHWPGNIRELENVLERSILFGNSTTIDIGDLPEPLPSPTLSDVPTQADRASTGPVTFGSLGKPEESLGTTSLKDIVRAQTSVVEKELIEQALEETKGNVTQAAKLLQISRKSLQTKMKDLNLRSRSTE